MSGACDLILLGADFSVIAIAEDYSELRWTRRYFSCGEFSLSLPPSHLYRGAAAQTRYIYNPGNGETALVEKLSLTSDTSGKRALTLSGRMLEALFDARVIDGVEIVSGFAETAARALVEKYVLIGARAIPLLALGPTAGYNAIVSAQYSGVTLLDALYGLLGAAGLSPRLTYNYADGALYFTVARGFDRTQAQTENSWAIFSTEFENVRSSAYARGERDYHNYFYIAGEYAADGSRTVVKLDLSGGGERREFFIDAGDIKRVYKDSLGVPHTATEAEYAALLLGRGYEVAAKHGALEYVEGVAADGAPPVYREGYDLGDICDYSDAALGVTRSLRITEVTELVAGGVRSVSLRLMG